MNEPQGSMKPKNVEQLVKSDRDFGKLIATEIKKTGFVFEHEVAQALKGKGWTVISSKYYVDDVDDAPREMDHIAYRVTRFDNDEIELYTVLIISCKKSEENVWTLLARDINLNNPNTDYWPLHAWSNDPALSYQLGASTVGRDYHKGVTSGGVKDAITDPKVEVFAFQEMHKTTGVPKNDKAIFSALTSLVKAQAYEISALPARKKNKAVYQFNLISVLDSEMYRLMFAANGDGVVSTQVDSEQYIARYIVSKRESFSRIRFLTSVGFHNALDDYSRLHAANVQWFTGQLNAFYVDLVKDHKRVAVLQKKFCSLIKYSVKWAVEKPFPGHKLSEEPFLSWDSSESSLRIGYLESEQVIAFMNDSEEIRTKVSAALKQVFRYTGTFEFVDDIYF